ncbi:MAG: hypothetical protein J3K34DRAFT_526071 [Monoraphidium minutum]|nr:MAG: hypothetical protein J3K34DRAFT_526071 [Monoraphidium minutum]
MAAHLGDLYRAGDQMQPQPLRLTLDNVRGLTAVLQAIKPSAKQVCSVLVDADGLSIQWEDDSKTLQSSIYLRSELFTSYDGPSEPQVFGLQFSQLVDTLSTFACASDASSLQLSYPGPEGELVLEMRDEPPPQQQQPGTGNPAPPPHAGGPALSMYARVACLEQAVPGDLTEYWAEPVSYFLMKGALLKEAVDDLEWPNGPVALALQRDPRRITLRAAGTAGALEIELPPNELMGFSAAAQSVAHTYAYRNLRAAFSNIPAHSKGDARSVSTKARRLGAAMVSIDASGLLKVTHMMDIPGRGGGGGGGARGGYTAPSMQGGSFMHTQGGALDPSRVGRVQFVSVPQLDEEDEDGGGGGRGGDGGDGDDGMGLG